MPFNFIITRAEVKDRQNIINLSKLFPADYLEHVVDRWTMQEPGGLYLAWDGTLLVACCALTIQSAEEAWIQGMRVHPDYQDRGIAFNMNSHLLDLAKEQGIDKVRLLTAPDNHGAVKVAGRLGFRAVGSRRDIIFMKTIDCKKQSLPANTARLNSVSISDLEIISSYISSGPASQSSRGLAFLPTYSYRLLTNNFLLETLSKQDITILNTKDNIEGLLLTIRDKKEGHLVLSYLDGPLFKLHNLLSSILFWQKEGFRYFSLSMLEEQHQALKPYLDKVFDRYEYLRWLLMEKQLNKNSSHS